LARWYQYRENDLNRHDFHTIEVMAQQYIPYYNKTRVIALHFDAIGSFAETGQTVPFYLEPTLGGNDRLRGFARYRFYGQSALLTSVEHRWHIFSAGHASIFFDMGKVANKTSQLNYHGLEYSGGIGLRFTIHNAVIMRIDNAFSREGYRFMWTFSNPW
jgi:outer membrane protein assembly factor BamA